MSSNRDDLSAPARAWDFVKDSTVNCCGMISSCCVTSWDVIVDFWFDVRDWIGENVCTCCRTKDHSVVDVPTVNSYTAQRPKSLKTNLPSIQKSLKASQHSLPPQPALSSKSIGSNTPPPVQAQQPVEPGVNLAVKSIPAAVQHSQPAQVVPPPPIAQPESQTLGPQHPQQPQAPPPLIPDIHHSRATHRYHSEPPKIAFVETGSIFGDRKRVTNNLLLLENGRFKSPGQPKIIPGPGGRSIRLSFHTGFPSIKSVESRSSFGKMASKQSVESDKGKAVKGSIESLSKTRKSFIRLKNMRSTKSYKSYSSQGSKELQHETATTDISDETENKTIES